MDSTSIGERSRIETRSRPGTTVAAGCGRVWVVNGWLLNLVAPFRLLALPGGRLRTERTVERAEDCIYVRLLNDVRRQETQYRIVSAIDQDSLPQQLTDDGLGGVAGIDVDGQHESHAADCCHRRILRLQSLK